MRKSSRKTRDRWPWECTLTTGSNSSAAQPAPTLAAAAGEPAPQLINPLGFIQSSLAGVTVDDLLRNKPALTMLLHDHNRLNNENGSLSNALNTANTYVQGYDDAKNRARTGAVFQTAAAIPTGFSINILTGGNVDLVTTGWVILAIGILFQGIGLYYAFWGDN